MRGHALSWPLDLFGVFLCFFCGGTVHRYIGLPDCLGNIRIMITGFLDIERTEGIPTLSFVFAAVLLPRVCLTLWIVCVVRSYSTTSIQVYM